jgi:hypothetical protein
MNTPAAATEPSTTATTRREQLVARELADATAAAATAHQRHVQDVRAELWGVLASLPELQNVTVRRMSEIATALAEEAVTVERTRRGF